MTRIFGRVAMRGAATSAEGWILAAAGLLGGLGAIWFIVLLVVWIGSLFALRFAARRFPPAQLAGLYLAFTAIGGVLTSASWV